MMLASAFVLPSCSSLSGSEGGRQETMAGSKLDPSSIKEGEDEEEGIKEGESWGREGGGGRAGRGLWEGRKRRERVEGGEEGTYTAYNMQ